VGSGNSAGPVPEALAGHRATLVGGEDHRTKAAALIEEASRAGRLRQALAEYVRLHIPLVDEVGYLACGDDAPAQRSAECNPGGLASAARTAQAAEKNLDPRRLSGSAPGSPISGPRRVEIWHLHEMVELFGA